MRAASQFKQTFIGISWISRHFIELYNANQTSELQEIRKIVKEKNNCDDLAMNFLVSFFYREIHSLQIDYEDVRIDPKIKNRQAAKKTFAEDRDFCNKKFIEIIGYSPEPSVVKSPKEDEEAKRWINPLKKRIVYEKRKMYEKVFLGGGSMKNLPSRCDQCFGNFHNTDDST